MTSLGPSILNLIATRQGLEPQLKASKASVLPLDDQVIQKVL